jgi:ABC-type sugar transport system ATPase subunit
LTVKGLAADGRFADINFSVRRGEIVGIAGVQGSGHGHVLRAIAGVDPSDFGEIRIFGTPRRRGSIAKAFGAGLLMVPADRRGSAIVPSLSNQANVALSPRIDVTCRPFGFRALQRERTVLDEHLDALSINPRSATALTGNLSGGNQQKVAIARALSAGVKILLMEEPTQGIDVHSRAEIHALLRRIARERGCAIVVASSEFEELIVLSDTIHVMRLGRLVVTLPGTGATYRDILHHALP